MFVDENTTGTPDELGNLALVETVTTAPGCRHRPLTMKETAELEFDIATEIWKSTIPVGEYAAAVRDAIFAVKANGLIRVDGEDYQIIGGVRHHPDMDGNPFKVTIISQQQHG